MTDINIILQNELDPLQRAAATDTATDVIALACAGSGKSRTMAYRIARLIADGEDPKSIVAFTFTEKAADSIKLRVSQALGRAGLEPMVLGAMYIGTIHAYCQHILAEMDAIYRQYDVLDDNRFILYLQSRYLDLNLQGIRHTIGRGRYFETLKVVSDAWKTMNDEMISVQTISAHDQDLGTALQLLEDRLSQDQYMDFSLMIRRVAEALKNGNKDSARVIGEVKHLLVDEYQDINMAQEILISEMRKSVRTLFVVGDDDQAIYAWRGADVSNILDFNNRYPNCSSHTLSHNYRSTEPIVASADDFVSQELGGTRIVKHPTAINPSGPRDFRNLWFDFRNAEAEWVAERIDLLLGTAYEESEGKVRGLTPADFAILMRSTRGNRRNNTIPHHQPFTDALEDRGIPFSLEAGGSIFDRPEVAILGETFELLRSGNPNRNLLQTHFNQDVLPIYPHADFRDFTEVMAKWGREIHTPSGGARRKLYPQNLVHDLLQAFGISTTPFDDGIMRDIGVFSRILLDVETVYISIDSSQRFGEILNFLSNIAEDGYISSTNDVLSRPDAVMVSTVHKAKGLEYPAVFVVDVEAQRFPLRRSRYNGALPVAVLQSAIDRGSYQTTPEGEARLFYTALTRAERYLYVMGSEWLPGGKQARIRSSFANRLNHPELLTDSNGLPPGLVSMMGERRIDESILPTSFSEIRYYLRCPKDYQFRKVYGFSPTVPEMFGYGATVHAAIERLHQRVEYQRQPPQPDDAEQMALDTFHLKHVFQKRSPSADDGPYENAQKAAGRIVRDYVEKFPGDFTRSRTVEARFEIPAEQAVISGSIDLLIEEDNKGKILDASVLDYKTMEGGPEPEQQEKLDWTELSLQVQLYAKGAREVLGENAKTGAVHLLKDNQRVHVPVDDDALEAAINTIEWAVDNIVAGDFPMRPHPAKCKECDFVKLCAQQPEQFRNADSPPEIHTPGSREHIQAFGKFDSGS